MHILIRASVVFLTLAIALLTVTLAGTHRVDVTAYTSTVGQTDSTPFRTSTGERVYDGVVAASPDIIRTYGYNAKVRITKIHARVGCNPTYLSRRTFVIKDATNSRYRNRVDVWFQSYRSAVNFGKCVASVEISRR